MKEYNYNDKFRVHEDLFLKRMENLIDKYSDKVVFDKKNYVSIIDYLEENYSVYNMDSEEIEKYQFYEDIDVFFGCNQKAFRNDLNDLYTKYNLDVKKINLSKFVLNTRANKNNKIFLSQKENIDISLNKYEFLYVYVFIDNLTGLIQSNSFELEEELYTYRGINEFDYKYITDDFIRFLQAFDDKTEIMKLAYLTKKSN
ncbi:hypothetical protein L0P54_02270 [Anaerosalibacter bizertensis]|uniref:Uncharacterized protein n=1 Tax=Anaerosalibacter bizertensis TaxID=932217 RepID=A0A9Q4AAK9_9FIRM|nr:hypothetical protein [Anaerosalibacter bizertensis]MBV1817470.1 hypothetical protein [Bacteroidales bacterium MSK.15.36]MBU5293376.1 hypothetical protein [Anaerosalibacter bizertensis]MCB5560084.1 hypothetical protein [Anaerosalibacter bizertensis]MCG4564018.1 hypothetical protein [Anaerosalibacter bizertensis]MCG4581798.1 hypothetical protein [Anaerosalibacter bizertensis]